jgi:hypothetical protein
VFHDGGFRIREVEASRQGKKQDGEKELLVHGKTFGTWIADSLASAPAAGKHDSQALLRDLGGCRQLQ